MSYKCEKCGFMIEQHIFSENYGICPQCGNYLTLGYEERIRLVADPGSFREKWEDIGFKNPLDFPDYSEKYLAAVKKTGLNEAVMTGEAQIGGNRVMLGVMDSRFIMASMGSVVGEKITRMFEYAKEKKMPVILFSASGGARMQEGVVALMQMAKTSSIISKFSESGGFYISILTNPTTGGVSASFSLLGDIVLAEPHALIGFAGRRVIEQTLQEKIPDDFQSAEYVLQNGFLDAIVERKNLRTVLQGLIEIHTNKTALKRKVG